MRLHLGAALRMGTFLVSGVLVAGFAVAMAAGISAKPLLSSSMAPNMNVGDLVLVRSVPTSSLRVGDIPLIVPKGGVTAVAHRIMAITPGATGPTLTMRGDANDTVDAVRPTVTEASTTRVIAVLPKFGNVTNLMSSRTGRPMLIIGLGVLLTSMAVRAVAAKSPLTDSQPSVQRAAHRKVS